MITPIILSGGSGFRLWPLSRISCPKQYLSLVSEKTLLQETILRVVGKQFNKPIVICNEEHRFIVLEQLQSINISPAQILLETLSKNTAPAVAVASLLQEDPEQLLLVLPADHLIKNIKAFYSAIEAAIDVANKNKIVTFGIKPQGPETAYGYIERGDLINKEELLFEVKKFIEKPDLELAKELINSDRCYWNSGIFLFKAKSMLQELVILQPQLLASCKKVIDYARSDLSFLRLDSKQIDSEYNQPIDRAVMENTKNAAVIPIDPGWSDLGTWKVLWDLAPKNINNNVLLGNVIAKQVRDCYIRANNKQLIAAVGIDNIIITATDDAILVSSRESIDQIKEIIDDLKENNRKELIMHKKVYKPWGYYQTIDSQDRFQVKKIIIKPNAKISTQIHYHRSEHWIIVAGTAKVTKGEEILILHENEAVYLPIGIKHSVENPGKIPLHLVEVQSGSYLGEDDIVRFEDLYNRVSKQSSVEDLIKVEEEAKDFGFCWKNKEMIIQQAISECDEIKEAIKQESEDKLQEEIGDLIHAAISLCVFAGYKIEETIAKTSKKFSTRIKFLKSLAKQYGLENLNNQPAEFLLELWEKAKKHNKEFNKVE